jgi:uncharacterized protein YecE (DUF72 family)
MESVPPLVVIRNTQAMNHDVAVDAELHAKPTLYLGCPVWACPAWVGPFFTPDSKPRDFLKQYSSVFNTVEGNSTFYALPSRDTVRRWANETADGFRFCVSAHKDQS